MFLFYPQSAQTYFLLLLATYIFQVGFAFSQIWSKTELKNLVKIRWRPIIGFNHQEIAKSLLGNLQALTNVENILILSPTCSLIIWRFLLSWSSRTFYQYSNRNATG